MLELYYKPTCAFCRRVMAVIDRLDLTVDMKDVADPETAEELKKVAGKIQTPYLVDSDMKVSLFESDDIVNHLQKNYGQPNSQPAKPRIHIGDSSCSSCEA